MLKSVWSRVRSWFTAKPTTPPPVTPYKPPQVPQRPNTPFIPPAGTSKADYLRDELVRLVSRDLGARETAGKNRSPLIDMINDAIPDGYSGAPYCISGLLIRGVRDLCKLHGLANPVKMTASTQGFYDSTPAKFKHPKGTLARKGDIGIQQSKSNASRGHAYLVAADEKASSIQYTIEYNTDGSGGRDGDGVYARTRSQNGDLLKRYRGSVDVVAWILSANPNWQVPQAKVVA